MKKKITAAALALCLVLGLLPMSALAAQYKGILNGSEITIDVDDTTGAYERKTILDHYTLAPGTITLTSGKLPSTYAFTLSHYGEAPGTIMVTGSLVEEPAAQTFTMTFAAGDHATGTKDTEALTVPEGETSVEYTLPNEEGFTPKSGYVFSGWYVGEGTDLKKAGDKIDLTADVTLTAQWTLETVTVKPGADGTVTLPTNAAESITEESEKFIVSVENVDEKGATVNLPADVVTAVDQSKAETVDIETSFVDTKVPAKALADANTDVKVTVKPVDGKDLTLPADTNDTVKKDIATATATTVSVTGKDGKNLFEKKADYTGIEPIEITIKGLLTGKTYVLLCLSDGVLTRFGRFEKIDGTINFKSRHLSDFIPVQETAENAAALAAVAEDPGKADGTVTPPATAVKVESVKTDITLFTKVKVSGMDKNKVYLIVVGSIAKGSSQSNFVIDGVDTHEFYCNTQGGKQTIGVYEFASKDTIQSGDITANLKLRADVAKVTE